MFENEKTYSFFKNKKIDVDGFSIQPHPKDANKSIVNYVARVDPKGKTIYQLKQHRSKLRKQEASQHLL